MLYFLLFVIGIRVVRFSVDRSHNLKTNQYILLIYRLAQLLNIIIFVAYVYNMMTAIFNTMCIRKQDIKPSMNINDLYQNIFICLSISECMFKIIFHIIKKSNWLNVSSLVTKDNKMCTMIYSFQYIWFPYSAYMFQYINRTLSISFSVCVEMCT